MLQGDQQFPIGNMRNSRRGSWRCFFLRGGCAALFHMLHCSKLYEGILSDLNSFELRNDHQNEYTPVTNDLANDGPNAH